MSNQEVGLVVYFEEECIEYFTILTSTSMGASVELPIVFGFDFCARICCIKCES